MLLMRMTVMYAVHILIVHSACVDPVSLHTPCHTIGTTHAAVPAAVISFHIIVYEAAIEKLLLLFEHAYLLPS